MIKQNKKTDKKYGLKREEAMRYSAKKTVDSGKTVEVSVVLNQVLTLDFNFI